MKEKETTKDSRRLYNDLAWVWPIFSPPEDYVEESELFAKTIKEHAQIETKTLLHLGCGAGGNDFTLKKYFTMTGVDLSEPMLEQARGLNGEASYFTGDMRTVRLEQTFDAVTALDSIDYNRTEADIRATFETAYAHLKPGGLFLTVIEYDADNFPQNQTTVTTNKKTTEEGEIEVTFIENNYDPDRRDTSFEATFVYLIRKNGKQEIHTDGHLVGLFKREVWPRLLNETGFDVKELKFTHSTFEKGAYMPMLVGIKMAEPARAR